VDRNIHLIVGDYWKVWPSVDEAMRLSGQKDFYGMAERAEEVRERILDRLSRNPNEHILCIDDDLALCVQSLTHTIGASEYQGKSISAAVQIVEEGKTPAGASYRIIDLKE
jgi:hypothetical protein